MSSLLSVLSSSLLFGSALSAWCDEEYECADTTVDDENVYCYGYQSCADSDVTSEEQTYAHGELACWDADVTSEYNLYCYGLMSCYDATLYIDNDFYCEGYAGAAYSSIELNDDLISRGIFSLYDTEIEGEDYAYIYGYGTALGAEMEDFNRFYNYGYLSMAFAEIYTGGDEKTFYMYNYGYYSSYGATLYCESEDTCYVYCDSTGCDGLTIYYASDATLSYSCSDDCASCPTVEEYDDLEKLKTSSSYLQRQKERKQFKQLMGQWVPRLEKKANKEERIAAKKAGNLSHKRNKHTVKKLAAHLGLEPKPVHVQNSVKTLTVVNDMHKPQASSNVQLFSFGIGVLAAFVVSTGAVVVSSKMQKQ